jgi:ABC-type lipoprotein release transport system permease subunit
VIKLTFRIFVKSLRLAIRTGKRFWIFVGIYAILMATTAITLDMALDGGSIWPVVGLVLGTAIMALFYGLIISGYRKTQVATLRCLGWTSGDIKWLFLGELILVVAVAAFIDFEVVIHYIGISTYLGLAPTPPVDAVLFLLTFLLILGVQFIGIFVAYRRMLSVRPMEALRKL